MPAASGPRPRHVTGGGRGRDGPKERVCRAPRRRRDLYAGPPRPTSARPRRAEHAVALSVGPARPQAPPPRLPARPLAARPRRSRPPLVSRFAPSGPRHWPRGPATSDARPGENGRLDLPPAAELQTRAVRPPTPPPTPPADVFPRPQTVRAAPYLLGPGAVFPPPVSTSLPRPLRPGRAAPVSLRRRGAAGAGARPGWGSGRRVRRFRRLSSAPAC